MQRRDFLKTSALCAFGATMLPEILLANETKNKYVTLNNGIKMPMLGLGMWDLKGAECKKVVLEAIEIGYRSFDSAQMYGNEKELGSAIKSAILGGIPREELFVTTKIVNAKNIDEARRKIDESAQKIGSYIDLMLIHWPQQNNLDIYSALEMAYDEGIIKACGISNFYGKELDEILNKTRIKPVVNQCEMHIYMQNQDLQKKLKARNIFLEAYSPFGGAKNSQEILNNPELIKIAQAHNKTTAQIVLAWLINNRIIAIPKTSKKERLKENFDIFDIKLNQNELKAIALLDKNQSLRGW